MDFSGIVLVFGFWPSSGSTLRVMTVNVHIRMAIGCQQCDASIISVNNGILIVLKQTFNIIITGDFTPTCTCIYAKYTVEITTIISSYIILL